MFNDAGVLRDDLGYGSFDAAERDLATRMSAAWARPAKKTNSRVSVCAACTLKTPSAARPSRVTLIAAVREST